MLKVGNIVTPEGLRIGSGFLFEIIGTAPEDNQLFQLRRIAQALDSINGPYQEQLNRIEKVENLFWREDDLILIKSNIIERKENKMEKLDLLDLYKKRKKESVKKKYDNLIQEIKDSDAIQEIMKDTNRLIQDTDSDREFPKVVLNVYTKETEEDIADMETAYKMEIKELNDLIEEVETYFNMTEDFSERKEILKNYGIIDKKGKLNI